MERDKQQIFKEDFGLLIEAGFIAVKQLDETSANRIFHAAQIISPHSVAPLIGLGYIALNKLEIKEATKIFETVVKQEPENYLGQVFLGMCFLLTKHKRSQGETLIQEVLEKTNDPTIVNLAKTSLEWAEKDLKTGKTRIPYNDGSKESGEKKGFPEAETSSTEKK